MRKKFVAKNFILVALIVTFLAPMLLVPTETFAQFDPAEGNPTIGGHPLGANSAGRNWWDSTTGFFGGIIDFIKNPVTWFADKAIVGAALAINLIIAGIAKAFLVLAGWSIDFALSLNSQVLLLPAVQVGWRIVRDIANLGFVLGIIVIAFGTILRSQSYGMRQALWKLIVMAVLVNFSLSICGVFLDAAGIITQFFIDKATGAGGWSFSFALAGAFSPGLFEPVNGGAGLDVIPRMLQALASVFFTFIFTFVALVSFFSLSTMLLIRFVHVAFLLILAPIAWLGWVFPNISVGSGNIYHMWWSKFIQWTFFPPIVSFFLYLAIYTMKDSAGTTARIISTANQAGSAAGDAFAGKLMLGNAAATGIGLTASIGEMFVFLALMNGGLMAAHALSITGAATAIKIAGWGGSFVTGLVTGGAIAVKNRAMLARQQPVMDKDNKPTGQTTTAAQRVAMRLSTMKIPGLGAFGQVGKVFQGAAIGVSKATKGIQETVEARAKELEVLPKEHQQRLAKAVTSLTNPIEAAAISITNAKGGYKDTDGKQLDAGLVDLLIKANQTTNTERKVLDYNPHFADKFGAKFGWEAGKEVEEAMKKISPDKYPDWNKDAFAGPAGQKVVLNMSSSGIRNIGERGTPELQKKFIDSFEALEKDLKDSDKPKYTELKRVIYTNIDYQGVVDPEKREAFKKEMRAKKKERAEGKDWREPRGYM